jgi:uncharacterized protein (TIGR03437 family)
VNVLIQPAVPAIYTQDQSGTGAAAALNGVTNVLVTSSTPLHPGDYVSLYLTGLGSEQPTVTVGAEPCAVTYAGVAPGFPGLNQINCQIASTVAASSTAPVLVTVGGRASNQVTLAIE